MTEFMGLLGGSYDAKAAGAEGFSPGGASLHPASTPHGPDKQAYEKAIAADTSVPVRLDAGLAFMFETSALLTLSETASTSAVTQHNYVECWRDLPRASIPPCA